MTLRNACILLLSRSFMNVQEVDGTSKFILFILFSIYIFFDFHKCIFLIQPDKFLLVLKKVQKW